MITVSYVNYWKNNKNVQDRWLLKFIEENIGEVKLINIKDNPDILICSCFGSINNIKNINAKIKLFYYGENLERYPPYNNIELLKSTFNMIVGFKYTDKKNKIFRLPLWLHYYPFYNMKNKTKNIITYLENQYNTNKKIEKNVFCSLISRHDREGQRIILLNETQKYGAVLCPGKFNNNCERILIGNTAKIDFIKNTKYNICPENSEFEGYHTEKIFEAFEGGTIPIYWAITEPEQNILNKNKYCFIQNINDKAEVEKKIKDVIKHPDKYLEGNIFNTNALEVIGTYYDDVIQELKRLMDI